MLKVWGGVCLWSLCLHEVAFAAMHMLSVLSITPFHTCIVYLPLSRLDGNLLVCCSLLQSAIVGHHLFWWQSSLPQLVAVRHCWLPFVVDGNLVRRSLLLFATVGRHMSLMTILLEWFILIEVMWLCITI